VTFNVVEGRSVASVQDDVDNDDDDDAYLVNVFTLPSNKVALAGTVHCCFETVVTVLQLKGAAGYAAHIREHSC